WRSLENSLKSLESARPKISVLHTVHEQQHFLFVAELSEAKQKFWTRRRQTAFALDAFNQNRNRRRRNRGAHGIQVIVRHVPKARHHRFKSFFHLVLAGRSNAGERAAVK